ncbi:Spt4/RpoE2 zinc finger-domain-containing protein [Geopyxis carbonaria]|nr:Spt4/RpoE2 zinc finger-domain-containing protein [Geopyxis carbonaria]
MSNSKPGPYPTTGVDPTTGQPLTPTRRELQKARENHQHPEGTRFKTAIIKSQEQIMSSNYVTPGQQRNLRACMICSFVQTLQKFKVEGCPNCEPVLSGEYRDAVDDITSPVFEGLIALRAPSKSWVARWQRIDGFAKGMYAVKVSGNLPEEILRELENSDLVYRPRDGSYVAED